MKVGKAGGTWAYLAMLADDISLKLSFFHACGNNKGLGGSNGLNVSAFERGDPGASLEKRMKSFGDGLTDIWRFKVK